MSKHPKKSIRNGPIGNFVIGDSLVGSVGVGWNLGSPTQKLAKKRLKKPTCAENELENILNGLNNGVLRNKFQREWAFAGKWILDFFFYENRLGIEVDGGYHNSEEQKQKDIEKEKACKRFDVTLLRLTNQEIFGDREALIERLREGYRAANEKIKQTNKERSTQLRNHHKTIATQNKKTRRKISSSSDKKSIKAKQRAFLDKLEKSNYINKGRQTVCWDCRATYRTTGLNSRVHEKCQSCGWIRCPHCGACRSPKHGNCEDRIVL